MLYLVILACNTVRSYYMSHKGWSLKQQNHSSAQTHHSNGRSDSEGWNKPGECFSHLQSLIPAISICVSHDQTPQHTREEQCRDMLVCKNRTHRRFLMAKCQYSHDGEKTEQQQVCRCCWWRRWGSSEVAFLTFYGVLELRTVQWCETKGFSAQDRQDGSVWCPASPCIPAHTHPCSHYQMWVTARGRIQDLMNQRSYPVQRIQTSSVYLSMKQNKLWSLKPNI